MSIGRWLYWLAASLILASVVHLFLVVFLPGVDTGQKITQFQAIGGVNAFHELEPVAPRNFLLAEPVPDITYAFCRYDVREGPVHIAARIPRSYWSLSVYTRNGDNVYTINDQQVGVRELELILEPESARAPEDLTIPEGRSDSIVVRTPDPTGVVLFRAFVPDRSYLEEIRRQIAESTCTGKPA